MHVRAIVVQGGEVVNSIIVDTEEMIELPNCEIIITSDYDIGDTYQPEE